MGAVVDMTGRVLEPGQSMTANRFEQEQAAEAKEFWHEVPSLIRYLADNSVDTLGYPDLVELVVHSLLTEAVQGAEKHERAAEVVEFIRSSFFAADGE